MTFRRRYNLPPTDPRFLDATLEDMATDYWAHFYTENKGDEVEDTDFDLDEALKANESEWEEVQ